MKPIALVTVSLAFAALRADAATRRPPAKTPPPVTVTLTPEQDRAALRVVLTNTSAEPVRIVADPRLLRFELRPAGKRGPMTRCALPAGVAPRAPDADLVVPLPAGGRAEQRVDLRFYCWGKAADRARAKAHTLAASYGFAGRTSPDRWVVSSADGLSNHHARLTAPAIDIAAAPSAPAADVTPPRGLALSSSNAQAQGGRAVVLSTRLRNHGPDPVLLALHPSLYRFHVRGPSGEVLCAGIQLTRALGRDSFTPLRRNASRTAAFDVDQYCPPGTFDAAAIYVVRPQLVATDEGAPFEITPFVGSVEAPPVLVRVLRGDRVGYATPVTPTP